MLRAFASYFFGGIQDEAPEAPIECETREVNDWLVVNLPDQNKDSVNLNDEDDTYEIDDEDIRNEMDEDDAVEVDACDIDEMDLEEDILLSLSFLMMPPDAEKLSSELSKVQSIYERGILEKPNFPTYIKPIISPCYFYNEDLHSNKLISAGKCTSIIRESPPVQMIDYPKSNKRYDSHTEALLDLVIPSWRHRTKRDDIVNEFEKHKISVQVLDLTPPPMYSKSYVNHRHPEKLLNQDLLQRIKELEPEQQAVQRSAKKNLTRGQLNRHNKNYMYETSSKKNRRSNRQRNHSGANNNRKC